ncbi:tRNA (N6-threonylcarbamoyladenosine(37)-N6)-methyltransferase TrmO [Sulfurisphaera ohwakuensis]|uniref:tRNA (N6-threonylcarbamoyladenosine(37)-N6)-methyltransferase TrmO n=1 Tax=Sulfurisphaera ohwakuensis TaxID=69656 RepID=A0A650CJR5_SULOH|nr:tRNA (N6-threonylcarbamoyladenosine(37)-N6)-methyltransferase TrmO [Sulfurisphaera ohwakuensis]MBB5254727.1 tRNA-Thr(GGU) m(6)t(6)A37 methyltransferase TsaA [Sulfurisphaera ohwakuensis]QGR18072.1 tRNA (N6-threonylcarbamoyladenosine(37)-N6)-methyltransferase TrmO [Sulfurisphaera ohwakuensis]
MSVCFKYIGYIKRKDNSASRHEIVEVIINKEYEEGLIGIEEFSHIILVYHLHLVNEYRIVRDRDNIKIGVFATRSQFRPNPIGISVCELIKRERNVLYVRGVNAYDGTPVLDIKPYDEWDRIEKIRVPFWHNAR